MSSECEVCNKTIETINLVIISLMSNITKALKEDEDDVNPELIIKCKEVIKELYLIDELHREQEHYDDED